MTEPFDPRQEHSDLSKNVTDLPLPHCGNGGNTSRVASTPPQPTAAELMTALDQALQLPVGPPLHDLDPQVVLDWAAAAARGLVFRRDRRHLVREVLRILVDEWQTGQAIDRLREQIESRERERLERADGTYWSRRDRYRSGDQPMHVVVDREAWRQARTRASAEAVSVGVVVGRLVAAEVARPHRRAACPQRDRGATRLFARIAVSKELWVQFREMSSLAGLTAERYVGLLVEHAFRDVTR